MSIQSNINQALSVAGVLATMNPAIQARAEKRSALRELDAASETIYKESQAAAQSIVKSQADPEVMQKAFGDIASYQEKGVDVAKKRFELDPSLENYEAISTAEAKVKGFRKLSTVVAEEQAKESLSVAQERIRKTRRNFLDYMKDEPSIYGKKYGDLDPKLAKTALRERYTKSQRQTIMNRRDAIENG